MSRAMWTVVTCMRGRRDRLSGLWVSTLRGERVTFLGTKSWVLVLVIASHHYQISVTCAASLLLPTTTRGIGQSNAGEARRDQDEAPPRRLHPCASRPTSSSPAGEGNTAIAAAVAALLLQPVSRGEPRAVLLPEGDAHPRGEPEGEEMPRVFVSAPPPPGMTYQDTLRLRTRPTRPQEPQELRGF